MLAGVVISPIFCRKRPALMIPPTATNLEVSLRKAFSAKSDSPDKRTRGTVTRLNVGFQAMKSMEPERLAEHGAQATTHVAVPVVRREGIVPKIRRLKRTTHDLTDVEDASKLASLVRTQYPI